jgi:hypothetical protein
MKLLRLGTAGGLFVLCSCAVLDVHHHNDSVKGIPFYVRTAVCRHEVIWVEPIYTLTLQSVTTKDGKETVRSEVAEFTLSQFTTQQTQIASLKDTIVAGGDPLPFWGPLRKSDGYNLLAQSTPEPKDRILVSNVNKMETAVDYRDVYYFNSHRPILGTAKADAKLNTDGTMTEGSGEMESKTLQSFLDLLPIKSLISNATGIPVKLNGESTYRLQIESRGIKHTHYRLAPLNSNMGQTPCAALPAPDFNDPAYNNSREDVSADKQAKPDEKNSIKVQGQIALPPKSDK